MRTFSSAEELLGAVGDTLGPGAPLLIEQSRIQAFADATDDHQWIHLDEQRAAAGPFGTRIAHGFLTLSLLPALMGGLYRLQGVTMGVNYGLNKVRFPSPLPTGSSVTASAVIVEVTPITESILQLVMRVSITAEGAQKPCCVAESVARISFNS